MKTPFEKLRRSVRYYYYGQKNDWYFPSNIAHISGGKMASNNYEPDVSKKIAANLEKGSTFIDVGANVGYFSRLAADEVGTNGKVYAFEVDFENYYALSQNVSDYSNIYALNMAVCNKNSFIKVNHSSHSACHSMVKTANLLDGKQFAVPAMTLDHFWEMYLAKEPVHLKIDVEGAESMVLDGMEKLLSKNMVHSMIIEFCPAIVKNTGFNIDAYYQKLASNFSISIIEKEYKPLINCGTMNSAYDLKFISNRLLEENGTANINLFCKKG